MQLVNNIGALYMKTNQIVKRCCNFLQTMTDNNLSELALINVANAKLTYLLSMGGAKFKQYTNGNEIILSYYGMSFLPSGSGKDYVLNLFNNYLIPFVPDFMEKVVSQYKEEYEQQEEYKISKLDKKQQKQAEYELQNKINNFRYLNTEIHDATVLGLYSDAEIISRLGIGALFLRIEELGDYIDGITTGNKQKKELFEKLKEISDGKFTATTISGDNKRKTLNNIPVSAMLYSDFENFKTNRNREYLNKMLRTGISRRSFIFMEEIKPINKAVPFQHKQHAITEAQQLRAELENIFNNISPTPYILGEDASMCIDEYKNECIDIYNEDVAQKNITIRGLDIKESWWKILKLGVVYHILNDPTNILVKAEDIQQAIDFYKEICKSFKILKETHADTAIEKMIKYIIEFDTDSIKMGDLRSQRFVGDVQFKKWFEEIIADVQEKLRTEHYIELTVEGKRLFKKHLPKKGVDDLEL